MVAPVRQAVELLPILPGCSLMVAVLRYSAAARGLHWLVVLLLTVSIPAGVWMIYFEPADEAFKLRLYNIHESLGVLVFVLVLLRLLVRWLRPPPPLPPGTPMPIRLAAHATHVALYGLLLVQPVLGFLGTNAWGFPLRWFGLFTIPAPIGREVALAPVLSALHWWGAVCLLLLIGGHLAGVVYHTLIRRDGLLRRML